MLQRACSFLLLSLLLTVGVARADLYVNFKDGLKMETAKPPGCHEEGSTLRCSNNWTYSTDVNILVTQGYRGQIWASFIPYGTFDNGYNEHAVPGCQVKIWRQYLSNTAEHRWHVEVNPDNTGRVKCWYWWHSNGNSANTIDIHAQKIK